MCLLIYFCLFLYEKGLLLFEREIPHGTGQFNFFLQKNSFQHLRIETTMLSVTPEPITVQTIAGSSCVQKKKNEESADIWKDKPQGGKHSLQPKARERFNTSVLQKLLNAGVF